MGNSSVDEQDTYRDIVQVGLGKSWEGVSGSGDSLFSLGSGSKLEKSRYFHGGSFELSVYRTGPLH